jgi:hypothetical protein
MALGTATSGTTLAPGLQKDHHYQHDEGHRLEQRVYHGLNGATHENGRVVGDRIADAFGEALRELDHRLADGSGEVQCVRARQLEHWNSDRGFCIEHAAQRVGLRSQLDPRHVAQVDHIAGVAGLDDDVAEFRFGLQTAHRIDDVLEVRIGQRRLAADLAGRHLDVLLSDRI